MSNCDEGGGCASAKGCHSRKGDQAELIAEALARLYPTRRFGERDDAAAYRAGVSRALSRKIARAASELLQARTYFREGSEEELCDYLYVLCVGREPSLLEVREGTAEAEADKIEERYLRVALSSVVRAATVQEVQMTLRQRDGAMVVHESSRDGVYDPVLLKRFQKLVDLLVQAGVAHFDFGMVGEEAPPNFDFGDYEARYGAPPTTVALLFYPHPPVITSTVVLGV